MKANKAPKKIWIDNLDEGFWFDSPSGNKSVEYVRADAFIENACDAYCEICDTKECEGCAECSWVIKFRRQLEKL